MAFNNNVSPGTPPLNWQKIKDSFDVINANFTQIGTAIAQYRPVTIINIDASNPVKVTTNGSHDLEAGARVSITGSGVSQLDTNQYYVTISSTDEVLLYTDADLTVAVDGTAHDAYPSSGGVIQGYSPFANLDFDNFRNNIIPAETGKFNLGSFTKQWKELHVEPKSDVPGSENNGLWLGLAKVEGIGTVINLPVDSTVDGTKIIDLDKTFFKEVQVDNGNAVVADEFVDSLNLISGTAMQLTVDSGAESVTFTNTGVTQLAGSTGISVSAGTGNITLTNTGVTSLGNASTLPTGLPVGSGIARDNTTGVVTMTNTGVIDLDDGFGITLSRDDATGIVTVTNAAPAVNTFGTFAVQGQSDIQPDNTSDTLEIVAGYGIGISTDGVNDKITFAFDPNVDINGSVFADDSTLLVDGVMGRIVADVYANVFGNVTGNVTGDVTGNTTGYHTGDVTGSVFADDSTKLVDAVDGTFNLDGSVSSNIIADQDNQYDLGSSSLQYKNLFLSQHIEMGGNIVAIGNVTAANVTGNLLGYHTGDMTGSVFGDDSTKLVDGAESKIVGPVESDNIRGSFIGTVFSDDSSVVINEEGTVLGTIAPGAAAPASETEAAPVGEIRVDDNYVYVRKSAGWGKIAIGGWV
jgi:hypothetical protein